MFSNFIKYAEKDSMNLNVPAKENLPMIYLEGHIHQKPPTDDFDKAVSAGV